MATAPRRVCQASDATFVVYSRNNGIRQRTTEKREPQHEKLIDAVRKRKDYLYTAVHFSTNPILASCFTANLFSASLISATNVTS